MQHDPRFYKAIEEFNQGLFFECHETLEGLWLEENGEDRVFYQGILQIAAGYFKWEQGVLIGAIKLWRSGLEKMELFGPSYGGVSVDSFIEGVRSNLKEIEAAYRKREALPEIIVPPLALIC